MNATTPEKPTEDQRLLAKIKRFREALLAQGYEHANAAGELVSAEGTTWVGTTFTHGEVRVYMWRRPRGYGEPEGRCYLPVHPDTDEAILDEAAGYLGAWAHGIPAGAEYAWPLPGTTPAYP